MSFVSSRHRLNCSRAATTPAENTPDHCGGIRLTSASGLKPVAVGASRGIDKTTPSTAARWVSAYRPARSANSDRETTSSAASFGWTVVVLLSTAPPRRSDIGSTGADNRQAARRLPTRGIHGKALRQVPNQTRMIGRADGGAECVHVNRNGALIREHSDDPVVDW